MLGKYSYHSSLRKYVVLFGNTFNDIMVKRYDKNQNVVTALTVPIQYSPKRKWVMTLRDDVSRPVMMTVPRLGFQIVGMGYDPSRRTSPISRIISNNQMFWNPIPYKMQWELYAVTKNQDDMGQIFEQIGPYFNQDLTQSVKLLPDINHTWDVPLRLTSGPSMEDVYEGDMAVRQMIIWTWQFEMDVWFFGPVVTGGVIKRVITNLYTDLDATLPEVVIDVKPGLTANGSPTTSSNNSINYQDINAEDDYGYIVEITDNIDGDENE